MASVHLFPQKPEKPHLNALPDVLAPCPDTGQGEVLLAVSKSTVDKLVVARRRTDLFMGWAHLVGEMPPVNNAELVRRADHPTSAIRSIADTHACFKGVNRPYDQDGTGKDIYVFIISSPHTVRWQSDMRTVCGIHPTPDGTLLTVQVRKGTSLQECAPGIWGVIAKWEFVNADRERTEYPEGFDERYGSLLWHR